jgi:FdhD protein
MEGTLPEGVVMGKKFHRFTDGKWETVSLDVPSELSFTIYVNDHELVTILCTPVKLNCLVVGYLYSEKFIRDLKEVVSMRVCEDDALADVKLANTGFTIPEKRILTSGCGGGTSFSLDIPKIESDLTVKPEQILHLMRLLLENAAFYNLTGGIHASAICDDHSLLAINEDIGRHNTLDKLTGESLLRKIATRDRILITTGRVSSEMLRKAARMLVPVVVTLTSPTEQAVLLAREAGIALVGYARGSRLTVYSHPERLSVPPDDSI